ncbi:MAG TPA: 5-formyltetrahydrofolate cyclo-ligase [Candidatus Merdivicinus excrementipullorum]|uniref:5-formyltetrahydrofolate cyclo-ligase n=1 Tax=Candidatus Merdivicinus excrementipullorum TaxID=2840867 RepID=A0A9D1FPD4_9FIRM|nr:5-formyltetrahydrofolate cyclo-ligase [Candidatus Merdivicinus excrementipullorum]
MERVTKPDIRLVKKELRDRMKELRRNLPPADKAAKDAAILNRVTALPEYQKARLLLTYVSTAIEVDTHALIARALADGKRVAVPYCIPGKTEMLFCQIGGMEDLSPGTFGVLEPNPELQPVLTDFSHSICILPGLSFDLQGYRLGYGKGYYDRFLSKYHGVNIGVCYNVCLKPLLPHGRYDKMVAILATEKFVKRFVPQPVRPNRNKPVRRRASRPEGDFHGRR